MHLNTACLGTSITPTVIGTWFQHYLNRPPRRHKPTAHISYEEGLQIVKAFLKHVSYHTVEDVQAFTSQKIPTPHWVKIQEDIVPQECLTQAAEAIINELGPRGILRVGGKEWWQWRGPMNGLMGEWIEMKSDYNARIKGGNTKGKRVMLYVHGGAYFFGSIDTHRYQMQRHARKLKARVFARYDCLAAYLYLLKTHDPTEVILAGDSAGAGMVVSMLVTIRDQNLPAPAGAILISPWVDLTHSFPSVAKGSSLDYIPEYGFMHRPSGAWPPPNVDDLIAIRKSAEGDQRVPNGSTTRDTPTTAEAGAGSETPEVAASGVNVRRQSTFEDGKSHPLLYPGVNSNLEPVSKEKILANEADSLAVPMLDGTIIEIKDQIQMYAPNQLLSHPLVSPVLQPSLGGLPPLLILTGGGEMLRDEQIYLAHKAADPAAYPPHDPYLNEHDPDRTIINKYEPTYVQLQVWDDLCHVAPTLSWTRPAKFMYRSIAQFGAWALARAQKEEIDIPEDDASSISSKSSTSSWSNNEPQEQRHKPGTSVGKAGDPLPPFRKHMIRQRVDRHGMTYQLDPPHALSALQQPTSKVGAINPDIVRKWLAAKKRWDEKFAREKVRVQQRRVNEFKHGYHGFDGELPPACALASRRLEKDIVPKIRVHRSWAMALWSKIASRHDKDVVELQSKSEVVPHISNVGVEGQDNAVVTEETSKPRGESLTHPPSPSKGQLNASQQSPERSRSQSRVVSDKGQANGAPNGDATGDNFGSVPRINTIEGANATTPSTPAGDLTVGSDGNSARTGTPGALIPGVDIADHESGQQSALGVDPDNVSTMAVRHADGVLHPSHEQKESVSSIGRDGAITPASFVPSESGSASMMSASSAETPTASINGIPSNLSTRAIRHAPGVSKNVSATGDAKPSPLVNTIITTNANGNDAYMAGKAAQKKNGNEESDGNITPKADESQSFDYERPRMPDRDEFVTAEEYS